MTARLTYDDQVFLVTRRALDLPVVTQTAWRLDRPVEVEAVERYRDALRRGPLGRRVVPARVPGARDRWVEAVPDAPLWVEPEPITPAAVTGWLYDQAGVDLDPHAGPGLTLALAYTADGGSVVSFVTSHVVADGGLKLRALAAAGRGETIATLPSAEGHGDPGDVGDLGDAARQIAAAGAGLVTALRGVRRPGRASTSPPAAQSSQSSQSRPVPPPVPGDDVAYRQPSVIADLAAGAWDVAAAAEGGTANSLFVAVCVEVLLACGLAAPGRPVRVAVPVSTRAGTPLVSNATSVVGVDVETVAGIDGSGRVADLAQVRAAVREHAAGLLDGTRPDPLEPLKPLVRMLPDPLVRRVVRGIPLPLVLASNLGRVEDGVLDAFGAPARALVNRAVVQRVSRNLARRQRGGLTAWCTRAGDALTLCLTALDPDALPDQATLRGLLREVCRRRGLAPTVW